MSYRDELLYREFLEPDAPPPFERLLPSVSTVQMHTYSSFCSKTGLNGFMKEDFFLEEALPEIGLVFLLLGAWGLEAKNRNGVHAADFHFFVSSALAFPCPQPIVSGAEGAFSYLWDVAGSPRSQFAPHIT